MSSLRQSTLHRGLSNPLKEDAQLQELLKGLQDVTTESDFDGWRVSFLMRFESLLGSEGIENARQADNDLLNKMYKFNKVIDKVLECVEGGSISLSKPFSVKGVNAVNRLKEGCVDIERRLIDLVPTTAAEIMERGYDKFQLGAVLVKDGFEVYGHMMRHDTILTQLRDEILEHVVDRQIIDAINYYLRQIETICDIMADLELFAVMERSREFAKEEIEVGRLNLHNTGRKRADNSSLHGSFHQGISQGSVHASPAGVRQIRSPGKLNQARSARFSMTEKDHRASLNAAAAKFKQTAIGTSSMSTIRGKFATIDEGSGHSFASSGSGQIMEDDDQSSSSSDRGFHQNLSRSNSISSFGEDSDGDDSNKKSQESINNFLQNHKKQSAPLPQKGNKPNAVKPQLPTKSSDIKLSPAKPPLPPPKLPPSSSSQEEQQQKQTHISDSDSDNLTGSQDSGKNPLTDATQKEAGNLDAKRAKLAAMKDKIRLQREEEGKKLALLKEKRAKQKQQEQQPPGKIGQETPPSSKTTRGARSPSVSKKAKLEQLKARASQTQTLNQDKMNMLLAKLAEQGSTKELNQAQPDQLKDEEQDQLKEEATPHNTRPKAPAVPSMPPRGPPGKAPSRAKHDAHGKPKKKNPSTKARLADLEARASAQETQNADKLAKLLAQLDERDQPPDSKGVENSTNTTVTEDTLSSSSHENPPATLEEGMAAVEEKRVDSSTGLLPPADSHKSTVGEAESDLDAPANGESAGSMMKQPASSPAGNSANERVESPAPRKLSLCRFPKESPRSTESPRSSGGRARKTPKLPDSLDDRTDRIPTPTPAIATVQPPNNSKTQSQDEEHPSTDVGANNELQPTDGGQEDPLQAKASSSEEQPPAHISQQQPNKSSADRKKAKLAEMKEKVQNTKTQNKAKLDMLKAKVAMQKEKSQRLMGSQDARKKKIRKSKSLNVESPADGRPPKALPSARAMTPQPPKSVRRPLKRNNSDGNMRLETVESPGPKRSLRGKFPSMRGKFPSEGRPGSRTSRMQKTPKVPAALDDTTKERKEAPPPIKPQVQRTEEPRPAGQLSPQPAEAGDSPIEESPPTAAPITDVGKLNLAECAPTEHTAETQMPKRPSKGALPAVEESDPKKGPTVMLQKRTESTELKVASSEPRKAKVGKKPAPGQPSAEADPQQISLSNVGKRPHLEPSELGKAPPDSPDPGIDDDRATYPLLEESFQQSKATMEPDEVEKSTEVGKLGRPQPAGPTNESINTKHLKFAKPEESSESNKAAHAPTQSSETQTPTLEALGTVHPQKPTKAPAPTAASPSTHEQDSAPANTKAGQTAPKVEKASEGTADAARVEAKQQPPVRKNSNGNTKQVRVESPAPKRSSKGKFPNESRPGSRGSRKLKTPKMPASLDATAKTRKEASSHIDPKVQRTEDPKTASPQAPQSSAAPDLAIEEGLATPAPTMEVGKLAVSADPQLEQSTKAQAPKRLSKGSLPPEGETGPKKGPMSKLPRRTEHMEPEFAAGEPRKAKLGRKPVPSQPSEEAEPQSVRISDERTKPGKETSQVEEMPMDLPHVENDSEQGPNPTVEDSFERTKAPIIPDKAGKSREVGKLQRPQPEDPMGKGSNTKHLNFQQPDEKSEATKASHHPKEKPTCSSTPLAETHIQPQQCTRRPAPSALPAPPESEPAGTKPVQTQRKPTVPPSPQSAAAREETKKKQEQQPKELTTPPQSQHEAQTGKPIDRAQEVGPSAAPAPMPAPAPPCPVRPLPEATPAPVPAAEAPTLAKTPAPELAPAPPKPTQALALAKQASPVGTNPAAAPASAKSAQALAPPEIAELSPAEEQEEKARREAVDWSRKEAAAARAEAREKREKQPTQQQSTPLQSHQQAQPSKPTPTRSQEGDPAPALLAAPSKSAPAKQPPHVAKTTEPSPAALSKPAKQETHTEKAAAPAPTPPRSTLEKKMPAAAKSPSPAPAPPKSTPAKQRQPVANAPAPSPVPQQKSAPAKQTSPVAKTPATSAPPKAAEQAPPVATAPTPTPSPVPQEKAAPAKQTPPVAAKTPTPAPAAPPKAAPVPTPPKPRPAKQDQVDTVARPTPSSALQESGPESSPLPQQKSMPAPAKEAPPVAATPAPVHGRPKSTPEKEEQSPPAGTKDVGKLRGPQSAGPTNKDINAKHLNFAKPEERAMPSPAPKKKREPAKQTPPVAKTLAPAPAASPKASPKTMPTKHTPTAGKTVAPAPPPPPNAVEQAPPVANAPPPAPAPQQKQAPVEQMPPGAKTPAPAPAASPMVSQEPMPTKQAPPAAKTVAPAPTPPPNSVEQAPPVANAPAPAPGPAPQQKSEPTKQTPPVAANAPAPAASPKSTSPKAGKQAPPGTNAAAPAPAPPPKSAKQAPAQQAQPVVRTPSRAPAAPPKSASPAPMETKQTTPAAKTAAPAPTPPPKSVEQAPPVAHAPAPAPSPFPQHQTVPARKTQPVAKRPPPAPAASPKAAAPTPMQQARSVAKTAEPAPAPPPKSAKKAPTVAHAPTPLPKSAKQAPPAEDGPAPAPSPVRQQKPKQTPPVAKPAAPAPTPPPKSAKQVPPAANWPAPAPSPAPRRKPEAAKQTPPAAKTPAPASAPSPKAASPAPEAPKQAAPGSNAPAPTPPPKSAGRAPPVANAAAPAPSPAPQQQTVPAQQTQPLAAKAPAPRSAASPKAASAPVPTKQKPPAGKTVATAATPPKSMPAKQAPPVANATGTTPSPVPQQKAVPAKQTPAPSPVPQPKALPAKQTPPVAKASAPAQAPRLVPSPQAAPAPTPPSTALQRQSVPARQTPPVAESPAPSHGRPKSQPDAEEQSPPAGNEDVGKLQSPQSAEPTNKGVNNKHLNFAKPEESSDPARAPARQVPPKGAQPNRAQRPLEDKTPARAPSSSGGPVDAEQAPTPAAPNDKKGNPPASSPAAPVASSSSAPSQTPPIAKAAAPRLAALNVDQQPQPAKTPPRQAPRQNPVLSPPKPPKPTAMNWPRDARETLVAHPAETMETSVRRPAQEGKKEHISSEPQSPAKRFPSSPARNSPHRNPNATKPRRNAASPSLPPSLDGEQVRSRQQHKQPPHLRASQRSPKKPARRSTSLPEDFLPPSSLQKSPAPLSPSALGEEPHQATPAPKTHLLATPAQEPPTPKPPNPLPAPLEDSQPANPSMDASKRRKEQPPPATLTKSWPSDTATGPPQEQQKPEAQELSSAKPRSRRKALPAEPAEPATPPTEGTPKRQGRAPPAAPSEKKAAAPRPAKSPDPAQQEDSLSTKPSMDDSKRRKEQPPPAPQSLAKTSVGASEHNPQQQKQPGQAHKEPFSAMPRSRPAPLPADPAESATPPTEGTPKTQDGARPVAPPQKMAAAPRPAKSLDPASAPSSVRSASPQRESTPTSPTAQEPQSMRPSVEDGKQRKQQSPPSFITPSATPDEAPGPSPQSQPPRKRRSLPPRKTPHLKSLPKTLTNEPGAENGSPTPVQIALTPDTPTELEPEQPLPPGPAEPGPAEARNKRRSLPPRKTPHLKGRPGIQDQTPQEDSELMSPGQEKEGTLKPFPSLATSPGTGVENDSQTDKGTPLRLNSNIDSVENAGLPRPPQQLRNSSQPTQGPPLPSTEQKPRWNSAHLVAPPSTQLGVPIGPVNESKERGSRRSRAPPRGKQSSSRERNAPSENLPGLTSPVTPKGKKLRKKKSMRLFGLDDDVDSDAARQIGGKVGKALEMRKKRRSQKPPVPALLSDDEDAGTPEEQSKPQLPPVPGTAQKESVEAQGNPKDRQASPDALEREEQEGDDKNPSDASFAQQLANLLSSDPNALNLLQNALQTATPNGSQQKPPEQQEQDQQATLVDDQSPSRGKPVSAGSPNLDQQPIPHEPVQPQLQEQKQSPNSPNTKGNDIPVQEMQAADNVPSHDNSAQGQLDRQELPREEHFTGRDDKPPLLEDHNGTAGSTVEPQETSKKVEQEDAGGLGTSDAQPADEDWAEFDNWLEEQGAVFEEWMKNHEDDEIDFSDDDECSDSSERSLDTEKVKNPLDASPKQPTNQEEEEGEFGDHLDDLINELMLGDLGADDDATTEHPFEEENEENQPQEQEQTGLPKSLPQPEQESQEGRTSPPLGGAERSDLEIVEAENPTDLTPEPQPAKTNKTPDVRDKNPTAETNPEESPVPKESLPPAAALPDPTENPPADTNATDEPFMEEKKEDGGEGEGDDDILVFFHPKTGKMAKLPLPRGFELGIVWNQDNEDFLEGEVESPIEQKDLFLMVMEAMWSNKKQK